MSTESSLLGTDYRWVKFGPIYATTIAGKYYAIFKVGKSWQVGAKFYANPLLAARRVVQLLVSSGQI